MALFTVVNGYVPSWATTKIEIDGEIDSALKSINYDHELSKKAAYGQGLHRYGKTIGIYSAKADFETGILGARFILAKLALRAAQLPKQVLIPGSTGPGYADTGFNIYVSYALPSGEIVTDSLLGCSIMKPGTQHSQGDEATSRKFDLDVGLLLLDGLHMTQGLMIAGR